MKRIRILVKLFLLILLGVSVSNGQWVKQNVDTTASFRGLSVVNEKIVWASGTGGTVIKTIDGGKHWTVMTVPGADKLDFRDIEAFDANTAYILSIGNGESSRIYKTTDGGNNWALQFKNTNEKAFFDAIACWDRNNCIAVSDPVNNRFVLIETKNGGATWTPMDTSQMPAAKDGEAAFAASGTCVITQGRNNAYLVSGGTDARLFTTTDRGKTWSVQDGRMNRGSSGTGIFSIAMQDPRTGIMVGGNYEKPDEDTNTVGLITVFGTARKIGRGTSGYRSGVAFIDGTSIIAVGTNGSDISNDGGNTWKRIGNENLNAVQAKGKRAVWAVGPGGLVVKMK
jgi:photosystem II stability/assembly factor-like uncharacterized protein